jgi:uncharacterized damage-inducible protein DinB
MGAKRVALISESEVPRAVVPRWQHALETYASETNKVADVWGRFTESDLRYRPHERSSPVEAILRHQLLSERRFFAESLGLDDVPADQVLPEPFTVASAVERLGTLARPRLVSLTEATDEWWLGAVPFIDVTRQRVWVFWRRVLHTAHHRTQLTVYPRLLGRPVPAVYGPSADETWVGADPTASVEAARRGGS